MLVTWPARREMIQAAIASFVHQDYAARTLTVVNDGAPLFRVPRLLHTRPLPRPQLAAQ